MARHRIRPTPALLMWALADLAGVGLLALGAAWLIQGPAFFGTRFPSTTPEAVLAIALGLGLIVIAAIKMLAATMQQIPVPNQPAAGPGRD